MTPVLPVERGLEMLRAGAIEALRKEEHFEDARRRDEILQAAQRGGKPPSHDDYKALGKLHKRHLERLKAFEDESPAVYIAARLAELGPSAKAAITRGRFFIEDEVSLANQVKELSSLLRKTYFPEIEDEHFVLTLQPGTVGTHEGWLRGDARLGYAPVSADTLITAVRSKIIGGAGTCDHAKMLEELERMSGDAAPVSVRGSRRAQRRNARRAVAAAWINHRAEIGIGGPMEVLNATYQAHAAAMVGLSAYPPALVYVAMRTLEAFCWFRTPLSDARYAPSAGKISFVRAAFLHAVVAHGLARVRDAFDAAFPQLSNIVAGVESPEATLARKPGAAMYRQKPLIEEKRQALGFEAVEGVELRLDCALAHAWMNMQLEQGKGGTQSKMRHHRASIGGLAHETYSHVFFAAKHDVGFRVQHHLVYAWAQLAGLRWSDYGPGIWIPNDLANVTSALERARGDLGAASGLRGGTGDLVAAIGERFRAGPRPPTDSLDQLADRLTERLRAMGYGQVLMDLQTARSGISAANQAMLAAPEKGLLESIGLSSGPATQAAEAAQGATAAWTSANQRSTAMLRTAVQEVPVAALYYSIEAAFAYAMAIRVVVEIRTNHKGRTYIHKELTGLNPARQILEEVVQRVSAVYGATYGVGDRLERLALATL